MTAKASATLGGSRSAVSRLNAVTRVLHFDDGDGRGDRTVTIPMPIFHVLVMLSDLGDRYWVLPEQQLGGHVVGGFASRDEGAVRVVLYTHHAQDTQSRSEAAFSRSLPRASCTRPRGRSSPR